MLARSSEKYTGTPNTIATSIHRSPANGRLVPRFAEQVGYACSCSPASSTNNSAFAQVATWGVVCGRWGRMQLLLLLVHTGIAR